MTLSVFVVSFFLGAFLFAIKLLEQGLQRRIFLTNFLAKGDVYIFRMKAWFAHLLHSNKQKTIFFFLFHLPERIEIFFRELKKKAHDRYFKVSSRVQGKQTLNSRADVSPFIRNIGPIEEDRK